MARYRVTCISKHEKYERIQGLGCYTPDQVFLTFTEAQVIERIEKHKDTFYVERPTGHVVDLEVVTESDGAKYVKTKPDGEKPDNLLSLPACPKKIPVVSPVVGTLGTVRAASSHGVTNGR